MKKLVLTALSALTLSVLTASFACAQDAPVAPPVEPTVTEMQPAPVVIDVRPDPLVFKRTPVVDGVVTPGEWDTSFVADAGEDKKITTLANWDDRNLYLAIVGTKPVKLTAVIDAAGDGWFHGSDNYKIECWPAEGSACSISAACYNSKAPKPEPTAVSSPLPITAKSSQDGHTIEMAIPQGALTGLNIKNGRKIGIRLIGYTGDSCAIPQVPLGDTVQCTLVAAKSASLDPVEIEMDIRDGKVTPGEELVAKLIIRNKSKETVNAEQFIIGGEGRAAKFLNSEMIRIEGLKAGAKMKRTFRTRIPQDMPTGSWGIGAEVRSADGRLGGTLLAFDVMRPYDVWMEVPQEKFTPGVYEWHAIKVIIRNNTPRETVGTVKLTIPEGWQVFKNDNDKMFSIPNQDGVYSVVFRTRLTDKAKPGQGQIKADITIGKEKLSVGQTVEVTEPVEKK